MVSFALRNLEEAAAAKRESQRVVKVEKTTFN